MLSLLLNMAKGTTSMFSFSFFNPPRLFFFPSLLQSCHSYKRTLPFNTAFSLTVKNSNTYPQNKMVYVAEYLQRPGIHCEEDTNLFLIFYTPSQNTSELCKKRQPKPTYATCKKLRSFRQIIENKDKLWILVRG